MGVKSGIKLEDIKGPGCLPDNETVRSDLADYFWEVGRFDCEVGQVLTKLEEMGALDNTILVVSGDNGTPFPRCKGTLYDLGTRVPLAVRWGAQVAPNRRVTDFVSLCDFAPTVLEAVGLKPGKGMTGRSLLPLITSAKSGQIDPARTFVLTGLEQHVYPNPSRAIRTRDFLYIRNFHPEMWATGEAEGERLRYDFANFKWPSVAEAFSFNYDPSPTKQLMRLNRDDKAIRRFADLAFGRPPKEELYDLRTDPDQFRNVAYDAQYAAQRKELHDRLDAELRKADDPRYFEVNSKTCWATKSCRRQRCLRSPRLSFLRCHRPLSSSRAYAILNSRADERLEPRPIGTAGSNPPRVFPAGTKPVRRLSDDPQPGGRQCVHTGSAENHSCARATTIRTGNRPGANRPSDQRTGSSRRIGRPQKAALRQSCWPYSSVEGRWKAVQANTRPLRWSTHQRTICLSARPGIRAKTTALASPAAAGRASWKEFGSGRALRSRTPMPPAVR